MKKRYIASFDAGTTAVKGVLADENGTVAAERAINIPTIFDGGVQEQDPACWWDAFRAISREFTAQAGAGEIAAIAMSGQMQDLIPLDDRLEPVCNAILYSDGRAEAQAARLEAAVGADRFLHITGNRCDGSLPLPKLMWFKEFRPELYRRTAHVLISSKDYLIARLTGACCGDVTACSTAGAMDIREKCWSPELLEQAGVERKLFPALLLPHQPAGTILPDNDCGYLPGTPVFAGIGDAGATTLASGIVRPGQYNINLGTSGWVASVSEDILLKDAGVFHLAAAEAGQYISVVPFLNAGNVHNWACRTYAGGDYDRAEALARSAAPGNGGLLFLPYLNGERYPILDPDIRGAYVGITPETTPAQLMRAALEGVAFSLRQGLTELDAEAAVESVSVIGGGSQSDAWCQLLTDVLGREILTLGDGTYLPALAVAAIARRGLGEIADYRPFAESLSSGNCGRIFCPSPAAAAVYDEAYRRYSRLYPALRGQERL